MQRESFIEQTVDWLNRRVAPAGVTVQADTRLFDCGVVDSLGVLRLIAWTEKAIGRRIQDREIRMDRFGSVLDIAESFVGAAEVAGCGGPAERRATAGACTRCARCPVTAARRAA